MFHMSKMKKLFLSSFNIVFVLLPFIFLVKEILHGYVVPPEITELSLSKLVLALNSHMLFFISFPIGVICLFNLITIMENADNSDFTTSMLKLFIFIALFSYGLAFFYLSFISMISVLHWLIFSHYIILSVCAGTFIFFALSCVIHELTNSKTECEQI